MTDEDWADPKYKPTDKELAFDYIKSPSFAVHWADGLVGAVTPAGYIHVNLYAEREAIPRRLVFKLEDDGSLGAENTAKRLSRDSVVRELSCGVMMSPVVARQLATWLNDLAGECEVLHQVSKPEDT